MITPARSRPITVPWAIMLTRESGLVIVGQQVQTASEKSRLILRLGRARQCHYVFGTWDSGHTPQPVDDNSPQLSGLRNLAVRSPYTLRLRKRASYSSNSFSSYRPYANAVKLPPDIPVITLTSSSRRILRPEVVTISIRRSASRTPYENAAARVPPPEKARMTRSCWSPRCRSSFSNWCPLLGSYCALDGLTCAAQPPRNKSETQRRLTGRRAKRS